LKDYEDVIKYSMTDSILCSSINQEPLITFYASLQLSRGTCEQDFTRWKQKKSILRSGIADVYTL